MFAAPHWVTVLGKLGLAERMRASGLEVESSPGVWRAERKDSTMTLQSTLSPAIT